MATNHIKSKSKSLNSGGTAVRIAPIKNDVSFFIGAI